jgi:uncharacterized protein
MTTEPKAKAPRGFAAMDPAKRREIASMGGRAVPAEKRSFSTHAALAATAGRKGGLAVNPTNRSFSKDHTLAAEAGKKGGHASHGGSGRKAPVAVE